MDKRQAATRRTKKSEPTEFERFEELTKGLLKVSKDELDEVRKRDEAERAKQK